jgi:hypothetical protein
MKIFSPVPASHYPLAPPPVTVVVAVMHQMVTVTVMVKGG